MLVKTQDCVPLIGVSGSVARAVRWRKCNFLAFVNVVRFCISNCAVGRVID